MKKRFFAGWFAALVVVGIVTLLAPAICGEWLGLALFVAAGLGVVMAGVAAMASALRR